MRYHVDSTVSMMGSEVDLAVESILPKDCTNIDGDVAGSKLITEFADSVIFRQTTPPPKIRSPSYLRTVQHCLTTNDSPSNSDLSSLSTSVVISQNTTVDSSSSECYFNSQSSSMGATDDYRRDEIDDSEIVNSICQDLIDEEILGVVFDAHRSAKCGLMFLLNKATENADKYKIFDEFQSLHSGANDIFGQTLGGGTSKSSKYIQQVDCLCPECNQSTAACRFAPHLEKCMGMGRISFRKARTRLAASSNANSSSSSSSANHYGTKNSTVVNQRNVACRSTTKPSWSDVEDEGVDDDDDDWYSSRKKGQKKRFVPKSTKKKLKNTPLKKKQSSSSLASSQSMGNHHSHAAILLSDLLDTPPLYSHDGDDVGEDSPRFVVGDEREMKQTGDGSASIGDNDGGGDFLDLSDGFDVPSPSL